MASPSKIFPEKFHHSLFFSFFLLFSAATAPISARSFGSINPPIFNNEATDTIRLTRILIEEASTPATGRITRIGRSFIDTPYKEGTLENDSTEALTINLDGMDCTTFVETVVALAHTAQQRRQSWRDYLHNLQQIRYRKGEIEGYPSRLHYFSEWILDNTAKGYVKEITRDLPGTAERVKSLYFMSDNAKLYPALGDSTNLAGIKHTEAGLSNHRYHIIRAAAAKDKNLRKIVKDGDLIAFTTEKKGLDVTHVGIIIAEEDLPLRLLHASSKDGKVEIDPLTLEEYIQRRKPEGIRIIRVLQE